MREFFFKLLFAAEYAEHHRNRIRAQSIAIRRPGAARFALTEAFTVEQIENMLAGTHNTPAVQAIVAKLSSRIVELSDRATDEPRAGFSDQDRLHVCGKVAGVADILRELQELTKDRPSAGAA